MYVCMYVCMYKPDKTIRGRAEFIDALCILFVHRFHAGLCLFFISLKIYAALTMEGAVTGVHH